MGKNKKRTETCRIAANREKANGYFVISLESRYMATSFVPGQFVNVKIEEGTVAPLLRIPLGIHAVRGHEIDLLYKVVGPGTELLSRKRKGATVNLLGPLGNGFDISSKIKKGNEIIIIAGGHGIAPLYALAEAVIKKNAAKVVFFMGCKAKDHLVCAEKINKIGAEVYISTEDGSCGKKGYVTDMLREYLNKASKRDKTCAGIYACGPKPMLGAVTAVATETGVPVQVSVDEYMACGIGACMGCAIRTKNGYKLVCKDGPVFDGQEIEWEKTAD